MSIFDSLAHWLGLNEPAPDEPARGTGAAAASGAYGAAPTAQPTLGPYAQMWESVDRHLAEFMVRSVLPHRHFAPDDVFKLVRIQVTGKTPEAQRAIDGFLTEFRPESRRRVVLAAVARNCPQGVSTDEFVDFDRDFDPAVLEESDPYDAQLAQANQGGFEVTLYGEWAVQAAPPQGAAAQGGPRASGDAQAPIRLEIHDATGPHTHEVTQLPLVLGRSGAAGLAVAGKFVSRLHGSIDRDEQGRVWFRDTSVNGSSIDGAVISPGERRHLRNGAHLRLGGDATDFGECPEVIVRWPGVEGDDAHTPMRAPLRAPASDPATPLRAGFDPNAATASASTPLTARVPGPLCLLAIKDAQGTRTLAVTSLPYVIGRGEAAQCRVPEENAGVSREHLVLRAVDARGAEWDNPAAGKWGTQVDGVEQPARFVLPWRKQVTLAARYTQAPPVTVLLLEGSP